MNFFVKNSFSKNKITLAVAVFFSSASLSMVAQAQTEQNIRIAYNLPSDHATGKYFEVLADGSQEYKVLDTAAIDFLKRGEPSLLPKFIRKFFD